MAVPGGPGYGAGFQPQPRVRFETLGEAWRIVQPNLGTWIGATIVAAICVIGLDLILGAAAGRSGPGNAVAALGSWIVGFFFQCGMARMAIRQVRGEPVQIGDLFSVTDVFGAVALGAILYSLLTFVGFILCIVPGIILTGLLMPMPFLIADRRMDAAAALSASLNAMKTDLLMAALFMFVAGIIIMLSALPCGIGLLFTIPMVSVAEALIYREFFPSAGGYTGGYTSGYPGAPPAGPSEPPAQQ
jgi:hypothetical protein